MDVDDENMMSVINCSFKNKVLQNYSAYKIEEILIDCTIASADWRSEAEKIDA